MTDALYEHTTFVKPLR